MNLIHCKAIVLNETHLWASDFVVRSGGGIFRTYLFDVYKRSALCDRVPTYELHPLYTTPLSDDENGSLAQQLMEIETLELLYCRCEEIDGFPQEAIYDFGVQVIQSGQSRDDLFAKTLSQAKKALLLNPNEAEKEGVAFLLSSDCKGNRPVSLLSDVWLAE